VDSERLYRSLWQACEEEKGISLRLGIEAFGIDVKDGRAVAVRSSDGPLKVGQILLASGVGMMGLISSTGVQLPVVPEQLYRLIGQPVGSERCCVISNYGTASSASRKGSPERISTEMEARLFVVFGKKLRTSVGDGWEIGSVLHSSDHAAFNELSRLFINFMPGYKNVFFDKVVSRFNALIADGLPIIGPVPNIGGLSLAMYHRDYKNILGPALGDWAAKWIVSGEAPEGATLLSTERFPQTAPGGRKAVKD
jgi:glycine/D-amino acid oxidase-like deaminating enzyme